MNIKHLLLVFGILALSACKTNSHLNKIEGQNISITDTLSTPSAVENFIAPYRDHVQKDMNKVLSYSVDTYSKTDGKLNTAIGNLMADAIYEQSNPIFKQRTGKEIDFVLLNHGGIRSILSKGPVTVGTAFEMMPFENSMVVVQLQGQYIKELLHYLSVAKRAHPISQLKVVLDKNDSVTSATVKGVPVDFKKTYYVATNDYLNQGGDYMNFFKSRDTAYVLDYKIRTALLDYFTKTDTINPVIDDRFIQTN